MIFVSVLLLDSTIDIYCSYERRRASSHLRHPLRHIFTADLFLRCVVFAAICVRLVPSGPRALALRYSNLSPSVIRSLSRFFIQMARPLTSAVSS